MMLINLLNGLVGVLGNLLNTVIGEGGTTPPSSPLPTSSSEQKNNG